MRFLVDSADKDAFHIIQHLLKSHSSPYFLAPPNDPLCYLVKMVETPLLLNITLDGDTILIISFQITLETIAKSEL